MIKNKYQFIKSLKSGRSSIAIDLWENIDTNKKIVTKKFKSLNKYKKEIFIYKILEKCKYTPNLICQDKNKITIGIEYCGDSMNDLFKTKDRCFYKTKIRNMVNEIQKDYKIYHNDIRWKNICINGGNIMLIDWEMWSYINIERDPEFILRDKINPK